jgi:hypothetical protein
MNEIDPIKSLREGLPAVRPEARDAARAALMERAEATPHKLPRRPKRRLRQRRALTLAGAVALTAAAILFAIGSGGGPAVKPEVASAADLRQLAETSPRIILAGVWQITDIEASAEEGRTAFYYTEAVPFFGAGRRAEIQWHASSGSERGQQLIAEGYVRAGTAPIQISRPSVIGTPRSDLYFNPGTAQVYVSRADGERSFKAIGLWTKPGRTYELRAVVSSFSILDNLLERLELASEKEWVVALQPGGAELLTHNGVIREEIVKVGEKNGKPIYQRGAVVGAHSDPEDFSNQPPPLILRSGNTVRVLVQRPAVYGAPQHTRIGKP